MKRIASWRPFLILTVLTVVVPLVWRLSGIDYDNGILGVGLFAVSYVLLWPAMFLASIIRLIPPLTNASWAFVASLVIVLSCYLWMDRVLTRWGR